MNGSFPGNDPPERHLASCTQGSVVESFHPSLQPHLQLSLTLPPAPITYVDFQPGVHVVGLERTSRVSLETPSNPILVETNRSTSHDRLSYQLVSLHEKLTRWSTPGLKLE